MALQVVRIADRINTVLSIAGLTTRGIEDAKDEVGVREVPLLQPRLDGFLTNFSVTRETFGTDAQALRYVTYSLNYVLCYREAGEERGVASMLEGWLEMWGKIIDALIANSTLSDSANIDSYPESATLEIVTDAVGNQFHGCYIPIRVMEWVNSTT